MSHKSSAFAAFLTLLSFHSLALGAHDPSDPFDLNDLSRDLPLEVEDAASALPGSLEFQTAARYERGRDETDQYLVAPQLEYGFSSRGQVAIAAVGKFGNAEKQRSGDLFVSALYQVLGEQASPFLAAVLGVAELPTGIDSAGVSSELEALFTQRVSADGHASVHFNAGWNHYASPAESERENGYRFVLGASQLVSERWLLLADVLRVQGRHREDTPNWVELGAMHAMGSETVAAVGAGVGLGETSPLYRITLSFQYSLGN